MGKVVVSVMFLASLMSQVVGCAEIIGIEDLPALDASQRDARVLDSSPSPSADAQPLDASDSSCVDDVECGEVLCDPWSACEFATICTETGTMTRQCITPKCVSGSCQQQPTMEVAECVRDTNGATCGATTCGSFSTCSGFGSVCDETGSRSRTCTDKVCSSGVCSSSTRTETDTCERDTEDDFCGPCGNGRCQNGSCHISSKCD